MEDIMQGLKTKSVIAVSFTADQWELFAQEGRDEAAAELNAALELAVNSKGATPKSVWSAMDVVQTRHAALGAGDSEPRNLIDRVIDRTFHS